MPIFANYIDDIDHLELLSSDLQMKMTEVMMVGDQMIL